MRRYVLAHSNASALTRPPPHQPRTVSTFRKTSGGRTNEKSTLRATSSPSILSQATWLPSPSRIDRSVAWPTPMNTPHAVNNIIVGRASWRPAIAASPQPWPMYRRSTTA